MEDYNYKKLLKLIGSNVLVRDGNNNELELKISEVNKGVLDGEEWEAFSVIYSGEKSSALPQGVYTLSHQEFNECQLFLSPNSEVEYETVVTRKRVAEV